MDYLSTRNTNIGSKTAKFCDILLGGLAPDGGLYLPAQYPQVSSAQLEHWRDLEYADLAFAILSYFIDDIPADDLKAICHQTYRSEVYCHARVTESAKEITPLSKLEENLYLLELSNGPTLAFKDMAMQLLGNLFEYVLERKNTSINILGATSGDTGSAAEYAMMGKERINVFMLSPHGLMSDFQRAQMYSIAEQNIYNIAIEGVFDDAQDIVKAVSNDASFKEKYRIGIVNSINWARVAAQIVYYFKAYLAATRHNEEQVIFAVPSGNFGNICAGHIAKQMGLPIKQLILATNENNVLDDFFKNGIYRPRTSAETKITSSPSMDISKASNFERFAFDLVGQDAKTIRELWQSVDAGGSFDLTQEPYKHHWAKIKSFGFSSGKSTHQDRIETIRQTSKKYGKTIDPHTADALKVAQDYRQSESDSTPIIVLETAQATKFETTIEEALGHKPARPKEMENIENRPQHVKTMPANFNTVKQYITTRIKP